MALLRRARVACAAISAGLLTIGLVAAVPAPARPLRSRPLGPVAALRTTARFDTNQSAGRPSTRPATTGTRRAVAADGEVPSLRTRMSRTYRRADGTMRTVESTTPLFYRSGGAWQPIDESLVRRPDGTFGNRADDTNVSLPATAAGIVTATHAATSISLRDAAAPETSARVAGSRATYRGVRSGVDETFDVRPDTVEQTYRLANAHAASTFATAVRVPAGDTLRAEVDGSLTVRDASAAVVATFPRPVAHDSSQDLDTDTTTDVRYAVGGHAPAYTVRTVLSRSWLTEARRVFPVLVDPTVTFGTSLDQSCYTSSGSGPATTCSSNTGVDNPVAFGTSGYSRRGYLRFGDLTGAQSPVPSDAVVTDARLALTYILKAGTAATLDTVVERTEADWGASMTWSTQPAVSSKYAERQTITPPAAGGTITLNPLYLVQAWVRHEVANQGLRIRSYSESSANLALRVAGMADADHPTLTVDWRPQIGQKSSVGAYDHQLSDRLDLHVDYGTRNLVVNDTDEAMPGPGQSLVVRHTYNSLAAAAGSTGAYGPGWLMNGGVDAGLIVHRGGVTLISAGGAMTTFGRDWNEGDLTKDDAFRNAQGMHATLTKPDSTHYRLVYKQTSTRATFTIAPDGTTAWLSEVNDHKDGSGTALTYTSTGSPLQTTKVTDTTRQRSVNLTYTSGRVTGMSESLATGASGARSWSYTYDGYGRLSTSVDAAGKVTRYCYGSGALLTRLVTPRGTATGASCSTSSGGVDVTDIAYDADGKVTSITYQNGSAANQITVRFATQTPIGTNTEGVTRFTDPYGKDTIYHFDAGDRITRTTDPLGNSSSSSYNLNGDVTASVSPNNFTGAAGDPVSTIKYDGSYNPTSTTLPTGSTLSATYTDTTNSDLPDTTTDDRGKKTTYQRNANGQVTSTGKGGVSVKVLHDGDDDPDGTGTVHCGPNGTTAFKGAVCATRDADYQSSANTQHRTKYTYDALGELSTVSPAAPGNGRTAPPDEKITYDGQSRVATVTTSRGDQTTITYDKLDRVTRTLYSDGRRTDVVYDDDGDVLSVTDRNSSGALQASESYTYDGFNRPATETKDSRPTFGVTWDGNSNLLTYTDDTGTTRYGYNSASELTSTALAPNGNCTGFTPQNPPTAGSGCIIFVLDKNGGRLTTVYPGNFAREDVRYDSSGRATQTTGTGQSNGSGTTLFDLRYDYHNGASDSMHIGKRTDVAGANSSLTYAYTDHGRLTTVTSKNSAGTTTDVHTYCYDNNGNRTVRHSASSAYSCSGTKDATWDGANQQLSGPDGTNSAFTFDLDGDETGSASATPGASTTRTTSWSVSDQATGVSLNSAATASSTYLGPAQDQLFTAGLNSTTYDELRNGALGVMRVARYVNGSNTSSMSVTRDPSGQILSLRDSTGARYYPLTDNEHSVLRLVDANGNVADSYSYDAFGVRTVNANTYPQPFGYTGAYTNPTTGLLHLGARYYDPSLGRFTSPDPQTHPGSTGQASPYPYASNDPVNHSDPTGEWSFSIGGSVCAFGGCLSASVGVDDDGDVNVGGGVGVGAGGGLNADFDPDGDYTSGQAQASATVGCNVGPVNESYDFVSGSSNTTLGTSEGVGCSAQVGGNYTF